MRLRDYQQADVDAVLEALTKHRSVLGRGATGLGKAVELAEIARVRSELGRVLVLVDVKKLVRQLAETIKFVTGMEPGIEMGDERANHGDRFGEPDRIVVGTIQTQYRDHRRMNPMEFSTLLLDECETFLADEAAAVVKFYQDGNPDLRVVGVSATPMRTDGRSMADMFDHVAFDHDMVWGVRQGWLVPAKQAFARVLSLDFSKVATSKNKAGEEDYTDDGLSDAMTAENERPLIELAAQIIKVAEGRKSIVICPKVKVARALAHHLEVAKWGCAKCIYGEIGEEERDEIFDGHYRGDYQFLTSVAMLTKGYDDPSIHCVFNCRKTKSKRLYQQIVGRGTRPLKEIVGAMNDAADAAARGEIIAASDKPFMVICDLVGLTANVKDCSLVDILGVASDAAVVERAHELQEEGMDAEEALEQADVDIEAEQEDARKIAEEAAKELDEEDEKRDARRRVSYTAEVEVEYVDGLGAVQGGANDIPGNGRESSLDVLARFYVKPHYIAKMTPAQVDEAARYCIAAKFAGKPSYNQMRCLRKAKFTQQEIDAMSKADAGDAITQLAANGWRRPEAA